MNGDEIRAKREQARMTQQELAQEIGVGLRTIGNWERGETVPKNRMAMLEAFFTRKLGPDASSPDPLRGASDVSLLAELLRRATEREFGGRA